MPTCCFAPPIAFSQIIVFTISGRRSSIINDHVVVVFKDYITSRVDLLKKKESCNECKNIFQGISRDCCCQIRFTVISAFRDLGLSDLGLFW